VAKSGERGPEQPVTGVEGWPRSLALEDGDLLAESQDFQGSIGSYAEESAHRSQEIEQELKHELTVVTYGKSRTSRSLTSWASSNLLPHPEHTSFLLPRLRRIQSFRARSLISCGYTR
jgi:hypothetical protein